MRRPYFIPLIISALLTACHAAPPAEEAAPEVRTPVTITTVDLGAISDSFTLSATSAYTIKTAVKAPATGYLRQINVKIGDYVQTGQVLYTLQTKESAAFRNSPLDTILRFDGRFEVRASASGIVTQVDKQREDYVTDGEQVYIIAQRSSLAFLLNVPYELNRYIHVGGTVRIDLPDHTSISGTIQSPLAMMDAASQTQSFVVKPLVEKEVPENLIARISIAKEVKAFTTIIPKEAIVADETQLNYWVMKLINDTTAVKVPVQKGIETSNDVEITSPHFLPNDRLVLTGQYGLADTAAIEIINAKEHE